MNSDVLSLPKADGQILTFDIPDEVLERAATPRTTSLHFGRIALTPGTTAACPSSRAVQLPQYWDHGWRWRILDFIQS